MFALATLDRIHIFTVYPGNEVEVIDMLPLVEPGTVPAVAWGYGLSPSYRDKTYPLLAVGWGRVVQLIVMHEVGDTVTFLYDGYFVCESEVDSLAFTSESILFVLANRREVKLLYTPNFGPGKFDEMDHMEASTATPSVFSSNASSLEGLGVSSSVFNSYSQHSSLQEKLTSMT